MEKCQRKVVKHVGYHEWKIENFSPLIDVSELIVGKPTFLESLSFTVENTVPNLWYLRMGFDGDKSGNKEWISRSLATTEKTEPVRAMCSLFILNNKQEKKFIQYFNNIEKSSNIAWYSKKFLEVKTLLNNRDEFLPNNQVTIGTEVIIYDFYVAPVGIKESSKTPKHSIYEDLKQLLVSGVASDVTLLLGNKEFKVHKAILMARCPEFLKTFIDTEDNAITVNEKKIMPKMDSKTFEMVLEFIYTDKICDLEDNVVLLLEAADKFKLQPLKDMYEEFLSDSIDIDNAIRIMDLAYRSNASQLFELVTEFIVANITKVMKTPTYAEVINVNPSISSIFVERLATLVQVPCLT
ncbi:protein roadkill-like [Cotesia typhae]|uniref:protein roadkill-like n=1 Tax=Cotesia typhae TaxID=2053667 RepID=UPI003D69D942